MSPILLRYVGFVLAAIIAGAGGGYLVVNNSKQSPPPITQSGIIPAIPAQPFPGQGIPAVPATPAVSTNHPMPPRGDAPVLENILGLSKCKSYQATPEDAYCLAPTDHNQNGLVSTQFFLGATGYNFTRNNNTVMWDRTAIGRVQSINNGTELSFVSPSDQAACSLHDVSVKTTFGTSNKLQVKVVDPMTDQGSVAWFLGGPNKTSGSVGTEIDLPITILQYSKEYPLALYAQFSRNYPAPAMSAWGGESTAPLVRISPPSNLVLQENVLYRLKIPQEINLCPTSIYSTCIESVEADKTIQLTPGQYNVRIIAVAKGQCSTMRFGVDGGFPFAVTDK